MTLLSISSQIAAGLTVINELSALGRLLLGMQLLVGRFLARLAFPPVWHWPAALGGAWRRRRPICA
ncbi:MULTISPECIES: hypothetical protein [unclassified Duganella]|uniref:hypothetical protein n=1 Tax=unclassified Duganella TaxID=2636909 RepID=UPI0006F5FCA1|nr:MULTISPECIES: hypothetical protein [unclassified Duganella]KQV51696.1 hypothetical protein ASD07_29520 [Duganella sp. Root336D2]KRB87803.1 hypothetical protein ASE26_29370 [Duganella sp. Root198D2]